MSELQNYHRQFCDFCIGFRDLSPRTVASYKDSLKQYLKFSEAENLDDFTRASIIGWVIHSRKHLKWSPKTIHIRVGDLKAFAKWCVTECYLMQNPVDGLQLPELKHKEPAFFTEDELDNLLTTVDEYPYHCPWERNRAKAIFATFIMTGVRRAELLDIRLQDVFLDKGMLFVRSGKNRRQRYVYFNSSLRYVLEVYLADRKKQKSTCSYLFASTENPQGKLNESALRRLFTKITKAYGSKVHPHKLRHSYATHMLTRGVEKHEAQRQMGHKHSKSIDVYTHVCDQSLQLKIKRHGYNCFSRHSKQAHSQYRYDTIEIGQYLDQKAN